SDFLFAPHCFINKEVLLRCPYAHTSWSVCPHFVVRMPPLYRPYAHTSSSVCPHFTMSILALYP
ncbi:hypothetical protein, partial [Bacteroides heparinolyticus]|uniref:hypothetical protein n=1 Tax=Prevotella heparinolytica TaxID=28113 RepID=UPI0035A077D8